MTQMQAFYDAVTARAEDAISYCDKFALDDMPEDVLNLMRLLYAMVTVSFPVECWKQPGSRTPGPPAWTACTSPCRDRRHRPAGRPVGRRGIRRGSLARRGGDRGQPHHRGES